ncbi:glutamate-1-semialdehyde 2,1-aminomutase [Chlamydiia bacterium]|nr:glutamate-1-semialdehyde 2,1-aminomutase [Chlamydiia bacterium]
MQNILTDLSSMLGGVNSPVRSYKGLLASPFVTKNAYGSTLVSVDDTEFTDFICSYGAHLFGHGPQFVKDAVYAHVSTGVSYGTTSYSEALFCSKISEITGYDKVRLVNSGTEATMTAVRLARGYTGKSLIVTFAGNYHGHADPFLVNAGSGVSEIKNASSLGVPDKAISDTVSLRYNNVGDVEKLMESVHHVDIACVILEPVAGNMGVIRASDDFLLAIDKLRRFSGCLIIFDEVMTGFRVDLPGVYRRSIIKPDLVCFGKVIGAGFPIAAMVGRSEVMSSLAPVGNVYQAGTLSGNPLASAVGLTLLSRIDNSTYAKLDKLTDSLVEPILTTIKQRRAPVQLHHECGMFSLFWTASSVTSYGDAKSQNMDQFKSYFSHMYKRGLMVPPSPFEANFISLAHSQKDINRFSEAVVEFINDQM